MHHSRREGRYTRINCQGYIQTSHISRPTQITVDVLRFVVPSIWGGSCNVDKSVHMYLGISLNQQCTACVPVSFSLSPPPRCAGSSARVGRPALVPPPASIAAARVVTTRVISQSGRRFADYLLQEGAKYPAPSGGQVYIYTCSAKVLQLAFKLRIARGYGTLRTHTHTHTHYALGFWQQ